ncbi:MAG: glycerate kinase [Syntrophus sp. (in: bacteria)]|nr:glycerate kinase [Syntrophus sp. (in: bacteria)]
MENIPRRQQAAEIFQAVLRSIDPYGLVQEHASRIACLYRAENFQKLYLVSFGKAAFPMAKALTDAVGGTLTRGVLITKDGHVPDAGLPEKMAVYEAAHPVPDIRGVLATEKIMALLQEADRETLVVCLISGGGSALLTAPHAGIDLRQKQDITQLLLRAGADIVEMNTVRKHLSRIKGGRLAQLAYPARVVSLILSDVIGDPLDVIASGPTAPDETTFQDALAVLDRYHLKDRLPAKVLDILTRGALGEIPETPKANNPIFDKVENLIIGSNKEALQVAAREALLRGYSAVILSSELKGEAREVGRRLAGQAIEACRASGKTVPGKICLIAGGETTVTVTGKGLGGRNTELALAFAREIKDMEGITLLSAGTDGTDGPTNAAGAVVDGGTLRRGEASGLDVAAFMAENDSYHFLEKTHDLLITGSTGTNVMDMQIILIDGSIKVPDMNR